MSDPIFSEAYVEAAHQATIFHEHDILHSNQCTCFYCGYQFDPRREDMLNWVDEDNPRGKTLLCPMCGIDSIIGDRSGFPITDRHFIKQCSDHWFGGISRISDGLPVQAMPSVRIDIE